MIGKTFHLKENEKGACFCCLGVFLKRVGMQMIDRYASHKSFLHAETIFKCIDVRQKSI